MKLSKEFKIGVVVVCAIAAFIWGVSFLKGINIFSHGYSLYAVYPKVENLNTGNPLTISGIRVGSIRDIDLIDKGGHKMVLVKFSVTEDIQIPQRSVARVVSDLLGVKSVELIFSKSTEYVKDGDTLIAEAERGLKESFNRQIAPLQARAENLLGNIDSLMVVLNLMLNQRTRENIDKSFESVRKAIVNLESTSYRLDDLMETEKPKIQSIFTHLNGIAGNLDRSEQKINNILNNFSNLSDSLSKSHLRSAINNADSTLRELNKIMAGINAGKGTMGKLVKDDSLYINLNRSAENLNKLLGDLKENPKHYVHFSVFGKKK